MSEHIPVLVTEVLSQFEPISPGDVLLDATLGLGGHAKAFCEAGQNKVSVIGLDADNDALTKAKRTLEGKQVIYIHSNFFQIKQALESHQLHSERISHILFDLGIGSHQLADDSRGFSFLGAGEPTMRFDKENGALPPSNLSSLNMLEHRIGRYPDVKDMLVYLPENELANIIWKFGEEKFSRRIAKALKEHADTITTAEQLGQCIVEAIPVKARYTSRIHPATRTFQALRIAINRELEAIQVALPQALEIVQPGGKIGVISFHSLEDRIVKRFFREQATSCICPPSQPICTCNHPATVKILTKKPLQASEAELQKNPRARSAKLRVVQKL